MTTLQDTITSSTQKKKLTAKQEKFKAVFIQKVEELSGDSFTEANTQHHYEALAELVMDKISAQWAENQRQIRIGDQRQVYFFSIEFLIGRMLRININNLGWDETISAVLKDLDLDYDKILAREKDPALGNGGLGRLMACFLDSAAAMGFPAHGNGIRYKYGLFEQKILNNEQVEIADNWLINGYPFEIPKKEKSVVVKFGGHVRTEMINGRLTFFHEDYEPILAVPYDVPIKGDHNDTVNSLRLWRAEPIEAFDLNTFNQGNFIKAMQRRSEAEAITQVLYPSDHGFEGQQLRLKQEYFFVCAGLKRIVRRYKKINHNSLEGFEKRFLIHINDTHPALCVPELMRILMDEENYEWDDAWEVTKNAITFTNHTVMPEALEKWPIEMLKALLPRIYMIIEEIDRRFLAEMNHCYPDRFERNQEMAILKNGMVHMAHLAIIGSHSVNGVAELHSKILREETFKDFYAVYPERFHSVTNGVTPRRFLMSANPKLKALLCETIGDNWTKANHLNALEDLLPYVQDPVFCEKLNRVKRHNKACLANFIGRTQNIAVDPDSIFDIQVKRIHEYKRQLLNALHILAVYNRLKADPNMDFIPKTFFFAGKAAPSYYYAKQVIKLINVLGEKINRDPAVCDKLKVIFVPNFNVSAAELIYPAAEISEQISTAGKEASGTSNMKFMMNGAVTLGTMDGANIEIAAAVGKQNIFTFGLSDREVAAYHANGNYQPIDIFEKDLRVREVLTQLIDGSLNGVTFQSIYDSLLLYGDPFFVLKDFSAYADAQALSGQAYLDQKKWQTMSAVNIAKSGIFSSDRSIADYRERIWKIK